MRNTILAICAFLLFSAASISQTLSGLPSPTSPSTMLTVSCPSPAAGSQIWRATGTSATVTLATSNWQELGTISGASGTYTDNTGVIGTTYGYTAIYTQGSTLAPPTAIYFGTPTSPLAAGTLSGATS
jgi:hypothetical protein